MPNAKAGFFRAMTVCAVGIAVGIVLKLVVLTAPALRSLVAPLYWFVVAGVAVGVWHVTRRRAHRDRRNANRRHSGPEA
jgi:hypothetical protein